MSGVTGQECKVVATTNDPRSVERIIHDNYHPPFQLRQIDQDTTIRDVVGKKVCPSHMLEILNTLTTNLRPTID